MEFFKKLHAMKYYFAEMGLPHYVNAIGYVVTFGIFFLVWLSSKNVIFLYIGFGLVEGVVVSGACLYNKYGRILRYEGREKMEMTLFGQPMDELRRKK